MKGERREREGEYQRRPHPEPDVALSAVAVAADATRAGELNFGCAVLSFYLPRFYTGVAPGDEFTLFKQC